MKEPKNPSAFIPEGWGGVLPPCQIQVDAEGELSHNGAPLVHPGIRELIFDSVHLEEGHYILSVDGQACELEVADTFFVVLRFSPLAEGVTLTLNDGTNEELDPATLCLGSNQLIYCRVKGGAFPARFARPAYYQIADMVESQGDIYVLKLGEETYPLVERDI